MFWKRKPQPPPAPPPSADPELDTLQAALLKRQEQVAALQLEMLELEQFKETLATRLGPWQRRIADLEEQLAEARARTERNAMWGERANSKNMAEDVLEQYKRVWTQPETPPAPPPPPRPDPNAEELREAKIKTLYRLLAKRFHPDLATTPEEKAARMVRMAEINAAYAARDFDRLQALADEPDQPPPAPPETPQPLTRADLLANLQREITRLDAVIAEFESNLQHALSPALADLMLEVSLARRAGRDLLAEMEADLRAEVTRLEAELMALNQKSR